MSSRNGIDLDQVAQFTELLTSDPAAGKASLRTRHRWDDGYAITAIGDELRVAGGTLPRSHTVLSDRPVAFAGGDRGPVPGELVLTALAACITTQFVERAALDGVELEDLELTCEAHLDLRGSLGIGEDRPGLRRIEMQAEVTSTTGGRVLDDLLARAVRTSPVADSLSDHVELTWSIEAVEPEPSPDP